MKSRLLRSLIAERMVSTEPGPGAGWTVGRCRHCDAPVWLSLAWIELLAGDPEAVASCFACACAAVGDGRGRTSYRLPEVGRLLA